jgi:hypothetical protein
MIKSPQSRIVNLKAENHARRNALWASRRAQLAPSLIVGGVTYCQRAVQCNGMTERTFFVSSSVFNTGFRTAFTTSVALFPVISNVKNSLSNVLQPILSDTDTRPAGSMMEAVTMETRAGLLMVGWRRRRSLRMGGSDVKGDDEGGGGTSQTKVAGPRSSGRAEGGRVEVIGRLKRLVVYSRVPEEYL